LLDVAEVVEEEFVALNETAGVLVVNAGEDEAGAENYGGCQYHA
jgi:hypothetical protein